MTQRVRSEQHRTLCSYERLVAAMEAAKNAAKPATEAFDLTGGVVIVTGGAVGIGRIYSEHLHAAGARVVLADIAAEAGEKAADLLSRTGGEALFVRTDISEEARHSTSPSEHLSALAASTASSTTLR
jgi:NAD(P)-dependent dehydrogenase (short-subunit alcohol dehydrogenase family)